MHRSKSVLGWLSVAFLAPYAPKSEVTFLVPGMVRNAVITPIEVAFHGLEKADNRVWCALQTLMELCGGYRRSCGLQQLYS
jgi:hypothetical protein